MAVAAARDPIPAWKSASQRGIRVSIRPIILAEDNDKLRRMYSDMLESAGFSVMRASDGEKAISLLHKIVNPQLIILDVMMPRMNGVETCIRMRKMQGLRTCPIVFLTALDRPENIIECLRAGGDDYLTKSAPLAEMLERVQYWSRRGSSEEDPERRNKAIKELEAIAAERSLTGLSNAPAEVAGEQAAVHQLAAFICSGNGVFAEDDDILCRFGYLVGLVEACAPTVGKTKDGFNRFLRNLVFRTNLVDRKEIGACLRTTSASSTKASSRKAGCAAAMMPPTSACRRMPK
jgi:DNA-binding response OmpR family regulator